MQRIYPLIGALIFTFITPSLANAKAYDPINLSKIQDLIKPFLSADQVITPQELEASPYVLAQVGEHVYTGSGNQCYARGLGEAPVGNRYRIFHPGTAFTDPMSNQTIGITARYVGEARIVAAGEPATLLITDAKQEISTADRLLPYEPSLTASDYRPHPAQAKAQGQIIAAIDNTTQLSQYQIVIINLGRQDGLQVGDVLHVYEQGKTIKDPLAKNDKKKEIVTLPAKLHGSLMVFCPFHTLSYAIILQSQNTMHLLDYVIS